jgi:hypothetical protein
MKKQAADSRWLTAFFFFWSALAALVFNCFYKAVNKHILCSFVEKTKKVK